MGVWTGAFWFWDWGLVRVWFGTWVGVLGFWLEGGLCWGLVGVFVCPTLHILRTAKFFLMLVFENAVEQVGHLVFVILVRQSKLKVCPQSIIIGNLLSSLYLLEHIGHSVGSSFDILCIKLCMNYFSRFNLKSSYILVFFRVKKSKKSNAIVSELLPLYYKY